MTLEGFDCCILVQLLLTLSVPIVFAPFEWREKLRVESTAFSVEVLGSRRTIFPDELLFKPCFQQGFLCREQRSSQSAKSA